MLARQDTLTKHERHGPLVAFLTIIALVQSADVMSTSTTLAGKERLLETCFSPCRNGPTSTVQCLVQNVLTLLQGVNHTLR